MFSFEQGGLGCPAFVDVLRRCESLEGLEALGMVVGEQEDLQVFLELIV